MKLGALANVKGNFLVKPLPASSDPIAFINVMNPYERMDDLSDDDYRNALNLPVTTLVIRHWDVPIDNGVRKTAAPLAAPQGNCNAELIGYYSTGMQYKRSRFGKDEVDVSFLYREFDAAGNVTFKVDHSGYAAMNALEKTARTDRTAALADLHQGSEDMLQNFAEAVAKRRARDSR